MKAWNKKDYIGAVILTILISIPIIILILAKYTNIFEDFKIETLISLATINPLNSYELVIVFFWTAIGVILIKKFIKVASLLTNSKCTNSWNSNLKGATMITAVLLPIPIILIIINITIYFFR